MTPERFTIVGVPARGSRGFDGPLTLFVSCEDPVRDVAGRLTMAFVTGTVYQFTGIAVAIADDGLWQTDAELSALPQDAPPVFLWVRFEVLRGEAVIFSQCNPQAVEEQWEFGADGLPAARRRVREETSATAETRSS